MKRAFTPPIPINNENQHAENLPETTTRIFVEHTEESVHGIYIEGAVFPITLESPAKVDPILPKLKAAIPANPSPTKAAGSNQKKEPESKFQVMNTKSFTSLINERCVSPAIPPVKAQLQEPVTLYKEGETPLSSFSEHFAFSMDEDFSAVKPVLFSTAPPAQEARVTPGALRRVETVRVDLSKKV